MTLMYAGLVLSTVFAFDRTMAMFGNIERSEGFLGLFFFYVFFVLLAMVFERKDWHRFFAITLFTGGVLFLVEMSEIFGGNTSPGSLTDNPIFLATYYLFVIFAASVLWRVAHKKNNMLAMVASVLSLIISVFGIFLTQTRGTLVGAFAGIFVVLIYFGMRSKNVMIAKNISARQFVAAMLTGFVLLIGVFVGTRHADIWTHIPGVRRIAQISSTDTDTQARFVNASIVFHTVNPSEASLTRTVFGWGWDNYIYAWQKFYNPKLYAYDPALFDRAHDKILDVLLMTGVLGLVLYLGVWFAFFKKALKKSKEFSMEMALFIFWGVAFFLQNLTVFDTLVTFITFYAIFAYLIYETTQTTTEITK